MFDASSMIHCWDNYPNEMFPPLWEWLATEVQDKNIVISSIAYSEICHKTPDCGAWLRENDLDVFAISSSVLMMSVDIKSGLGIRDDNYHPKGVGENDILIIAAAKDQGVTLVSEEGVQVRLPNEQRKFKIPAVCRKNEVNVNCEKFIDYLKGESKIFG